MSEIKNKFDEIALFMNKLVLSNGALCLFLGELPDNMQKVGKLKMSEKFVEAGSIKYSTRFFGKMLVILEVLNSEDDYEFYLLPVEAKCEGRKVFAPLLIVKKGVVAIGLPPMVEVEE